MAELPEAFHFPPVACFEGHAPAGGCVLAMASDYRILSAAALIGLNEVQAGLSVPEWIRRLTVRTVGWRTGEQLLLRGLLISSSEAHAKKLVDKVVNEKVVLSQALEKLEKVNRGTAFPDLRAHIKQELRKPLVQWILENRQKDLDLWVSLTMKSSTQAQLKRYLESIGIIKKD